MGGMDRVRYPAFRMGATPAVCLLLLAGCHHSPIEGKSVAEWEKQLREGDVIAQAQAALGLSKLGAEAAPAIPALIETLGNTSPLVRQNVCLALGSIGPEARSAVKSLTATLADPIWEVRRQAAVSLGRIGPDARAAVPALQKATADKHSLVQKAAKEALKQIGA